MRLTTSVVVALVTACGASSPAVPAPANTAATSAGPTPAWAIVVGAHRPCEYATTTAGYAEPMRTVLTYDGAPTRCTIPAFLPEQALACFTVREWPSSGLRVVHTYDAEGRLVHLVDERGDTSTFTWDAAGLIGWTVNGEAMTLGSNVEGELATANMTISVEAGRPSSVWHRPAEIESLRWDGDRLIAVERAWPREDGEDRVVTTTRDCD